MIRPLRFETNKLTAVSNRFQSKSLAAPERQQRAAAAEFEGVARVLRDSGVRVIIVDDTPEPHTPDSIFPNNWVSFHADGTVVLYPMEATNRRAERRHDIIELLHHDYGYQVHNVVDLSHHEGSGHFLEGTGSMVLDRTNRIAYACLSTRTHLDVLNEFSRRLNYESIVFNAVDRAGVVIYHSNVVMCVGESVAIICADAIAGDQQRRCVLQRLQRTGHEVITIALSQLEAFAGNMLELKVANGCRIMAMSDRARASLDATQICGIERHADIVSADIGSIERAAGGSVRCMLAEMRLPEAG